MYICMFDGLKQQDDDNLTIGIIFCTDKDEAMIKYFFFSERINLCIKVYDSIINGGRITR